MMGSKTNAKSFKIGIKAEIIVIDFGMFTHLCLL
jgi:hypothetical protein